ncbi:MAG: hypothetical protein AAGA75_26270 [Cyanobacteria bacterium P01_E01_bin.6]
MTKVSESFESVRPFIDGLIALMKDTILSNSIPEFMTEEEAARLANVSTRKVQMWKRDGVLLEDIHYIKIESSVRYILPTFRNKLINWNCDDAHQKFLEHWRKRESLTLK